MKGSHVSIHQATKYRAKAVCDGLSLRTQKQETIP